MTQLRDATTGPRDADPRRRATIGMWARVAIVVLHLGRAQTASAQSGDDASRAASARVFFQEGVEFAEQSRWDEAEDRFRRALALRASPVLAYNLASVLSTRGKLLEASELLRRVQSDDNADAELRKSADNLQSDVTARIARLEVTVSGYRQGDRVLLDDYMLHSAQLGVEIPIDPGGHQLRLEREQSEVDHAEIDLGPAARLQVTLHAPLPELAAPALATGLAVAVASPPKAAEHGAPWFRSTWFLTGAALVVVAGVAVGVAAASGGHSQPEAAFSGNVTPGSFRVEVAR